MSEKKRILIIEDDPDVQHILVNLLEKYPEYKIDSAQDARSAMDILKNPEKQPDAIIMDIMLPYGDPFPKELEEAPDPRQVDTGLRLLRWLRNATEYPVYQNIWVTVITARVQPLVIEEIRKLLGDQGRLNTKPFNDLLVEHDIACVLGVESKVPAILLPDGYVPPPLQQQ